MSHPISEWTKKELKNEVVKLRSQLAAQQEWRADLAEHAAEALIIASAVFFAWGDKFLPGTVESFRKHELAFLEAAGRSAAPE